MDSVQEVLAVDTLAAVGSGPLNENPMPEPRLEEHRKKLLEDIRHDLEAIVKDLEQQLANATFSAQNIKVELRQQLYDFIYNLDLQQLGEGTVLHELPFLEPDWEFGLPRWEGFLLRPPQPQSSAGGTSSRQRASASAAPGQQIRSFTSYTANRPLPISTAETTQHLLFMTSACKDLQGNSVGTFRGWVCVDKAKQMPVNGHVWEWRQLKGKGEVQESGWVDKSVALGVWEPKQPKDPQEQEQEARKRPRSGSWQSPTPSLQDELPVQHSTAATTAAAGGAGTIAAAGLPTSAVWPIAAAAAAAGVVVPGEPAAFPSCQPQLHHSGSLVNSPAGQLAGHTTNSISAMLDPYSAHSMGAGAGGMSGLAAGGPYGQQQQALQQLPALQHNASGLLQQVPGSYPSAYTATPVPGFGLFAPTMAPGFIPHPQLPTITAAPTANPGLVPPPAPPAFTGLQTASTPAAAAVLPPAPAVAAAAGGPADAADLNDIVGKLQAMQVEGEHARCIRQLLQAARTGGDLRACLSNQQLVDLLLSHDVVDDPDRKRNLLHLVATHSMGASTEARLQQLDVLLGSNAQLAARLMQATNNNGSPPLMVASANILDEGHAVVFRRLLQAADAVVLATKSKSGWTVLHCLGNTAAKAADAGGAEGQQRVALLVQLMQEYVQRVQAVSRQLRSSGIIGAE